MTHVKKNLPTNKSQTILKQERMSIILSGKRKLWRYVYKRIERGSKV